MPRIELESKVMDFICKHSLISPGETLVVAVSGGADSVCLLYLLDRWQDKLDIKLHIAHLNHQLRGHESEAEALYVTGLAEQLHIPITIDKQDVAAYREMKRCSLEEAAREVRYDFLARVAKEVKASRVALGHTRDDQVETILMHILRGTGSSGLGGLEPCLPLPSAYSASKAKKSRLLLIRPLLDLTREETSNYCQLQGLETRVDSSNFSLSFLRNRLRLELLPFLREYNPNIDQVLLRLAEIVRDDNSVLQQQASQLWNEVARQEDDAIHLDKRKICSLPTALQGRIIRRAASEVLGDTRDIEARHIDMVISLLSKPAGKIVFLPRNLVGQSGYDEIILVLDRGSALSALCPFSPLEGEVPLNVPGETLLPGWRVIAEIIPVMAGHGDSVGRELKGGLPFSSKDGGNFLAYLDLERTGTLLFVRRRKPGDRFQPLGMNLSKKLQDFMVDAKIPSTWRDNIPLVCSPRQIIWVVGWRIDNRVKVTQSTKEVLCLEFVKQM